MAGFTTDWQQKVLDHSTGKASLGAALPVHIALFIVPPTDAGGGTECNYTGYGRVATSPATWNAAAGTEASNAQAVTFVGACTGGTNTVVAFGAYDGPTLGNLLWWGPVSLAVSAGITPTFVAGKLKATLD